MNKIKHLNIIAISLLSILSLKFAIEFITNILYLFSTKEYISNGLILNTFSVNAVLLNILTNISIFICLILTMLAKKYSVYIFYILLILNAFTTATLTGLDFAYSLGKEIIPMIMMSVIYSVILFIPYKGLKSWQTIFKKE